MAPAQPHFFRLEGGLGKQSGEWEFREGGEPVKAGYSAEAEGQ